MIFYVCVILYNKSVSECETVKSLINCKLKDNTQLRIYIIDNSDVPNDNFIKVENISINADARKKYLYSGPFGNKNLSFLYNEFVNSAGRNYICFLDHDSILPKSYFISLERAIAEGRRCKIFSPKILEASNYLYSPKIQPAIVDYFNLYRRRKLTKEISGVYNINIFSVMSGLVVSPDFFDSFKFDERLRLYGIDNQLFLCNKHPVFVFDEFIDHSLSYFEKEDINLKLFRFIERQQSLMCLYNISNSTRLRAAASLSISLMIFFIKNRRKLKFENVQFFELFRQIYFKHP